MCRTRAGGDDDAKWLRYGAGELTKREFLRRLGGGALGAAGLTLGARAAAAQDAASENDPEPHAAQKNWAWMRAGRRSTDAWKRLFAEMRELGFHAAVPEVYNGDHALFEHPHPDVRTVAPVLEEMIPLAHDEGIEVHAWMWTMPCNNRHIVSRHPEWYVVNGRGESAHDKPAYVNYYRFLCARRPEVQDFVAGNVRALASVEGLDGVHLDYVRLPDVILAKGLWSKYGIVQDREYPQYDYCYCDACRAEFKRQSGIDPLTDLADPAADDAWRQFRCDGITNLVNERLVPTARAGGKQITAAVFPNWTSVRQEWHRWRLDGFLPMLYHSFYEEDVPWIGRQVAAARERIAAAELGATPPVYAGLFLAALTPEQFEEAIDVAAANGGGGISIFSYDDLRDGHKDVLRRRVSGR